MSSLVIVAIPAEDDLVHKISSEKVPHLTLMYLGEASEDKNVDRIAEFVEHALSVNSHGPFYLEIDHRGELGDDKADVLFFEGGWDTKWIKSLRGQLLQQTDIHAAYQSEDQFPGWVPHLTLGYPDSPAKPIPDDRRLYSVEFDRVAVWDGNYEGPEFRLKWDRDALVETHGSTYDGPFAQMSSINQARAAMGLAVGEGDIEHYGVKGMRWGQKKTESVSVNGRPKMVTPKKAAKLDQKFERQVGNVDTFVKLHNAGADHVNKAIPELNASFEKKYPKEMNDGTLFNEAHPVTREYSKAYNDKFVEGLNQAAKALGTSPTGKIKVKIMTENEESFSEFGWQAQVDKVKHAADDEEVLVFRIKRDKNGIITEVEQVADTIAQSEEFLEDFLEHYGVRGMKWGVRKVREGGAAVNRKIPKGLKRVAKDIYFETEMSKDAHRDHVARQAATKWSNEDLPRLKKDYEGTKAATVKGRLKNPLDPKTIEYRSRSRAAFRDRLNEEIANLPTNASGTRRYEIEDNGATNANYFWTIKAVDVKRSSGLDRVEHADTDKPIELIDFRVRPLFDDDGFITGFYQIPNEAAHSGLSEEVVALGAEFIEHYGVKGMRWGFRRGQPTAVAPQATSNVPHGTKRKTKIEAKGGENHPASEDALKVAQAKAKLAKSGTAALTNQELREVADRMRLEEQVTQMTRGSGSKFVRKILSNQGNQAANQAVRNQIDDRLFKKNKK